MPLRSPVLLCSLAFVATNAIRMSLPVRKLAGSDEEAELFLNLLGEFVSGQHPERIQGNAVSLISSLLSHRHGQGAQKVDPVPAPAEAPAPAPAETPAETPVAAQEDDPGLGPGDAEPAAPAPGPVPCAADDALCNFLERMIADPTSLFQIGLSLYNAYTEATAAFKEQNWLEMFSAIQLHLWSIVNYVTSDAFQASEEYTNAQAVWTSGFDAMIDAAPAAAADFEAGNSAAWGGILEMGIQTASDTLAAGSPTNVDDITHITDALTGGLAGWTQWVGGNKATGVLAAWTAVNATLWSANVFEADSDIGTALLLVDVVVKSISSSFATYEARLEDPKFCRKDFKTRNSQAVSKCYFGFTFDAEKVACMPSAEMGADCEPHCEVRAATGCTSFCPIEKPYCCKKDDPANPAECQTNYLDLDFTTGNSTEYFQCVSPAITVTVGGLLEIKQQRNKGGLTVAEWTSHRLMQHRSELKTRSTQSLDSAIWGKGSATSVRTTASTLWGAHTPVCDLNSVFFETIEGFAGLCFEECPAGYEMVTGGTAEEPTTTNQCKQLCQDPFSQDESFGYQNIGMEVCSQTRADVSLANNMALDVIKDGISAAISAVQVLTSDTAVTPSVLEGYITAVGNLIVHFSRPICDFSSPVPTPAPGAPAPGGQ